MSLKPIRMVRPDLKEAYDAVKRPNSNIDWVLYQVDENTVELLVEDTGDGGLATVLSRFENDRVQYGFVRVYDPRHGIQKFVLINWCGDDVPGRVSRAFAINSASVEDFLKGYHLVIRARHPSDLNEREIMSRLTGGHHAFAQPPPIHPSRTGSAEKNESHSHWNPLGKVKEVFTGNSSAPKVEKEKTPPPTAKPSGHSFTRRPSQENLPEPRPMPTRRPTWMEQEEAARKLREEDEMARAAIRANAAKYAQDPANLSWSQKNALAKKQKAEEEQERLKALQEEQERQAAIARAEAEARAAELKALEEEIAAERRRIDEEEERIRLEREEQEAQRLAELEQIRFRQEQERLEREEEARRREEERLEELSRQEETLALLRKIQADAEAERAKFEEQRLQMEEERRRWQEEFELQFHREREEAERREAEEREREEARLEEERQRQAEYDALAARLRESEEARVMREKQEEEARRLAAELEQKALEERIRAEDLLRKAEYENQSLLKLRDEAEQDRLRFEELHRKATLDLETLRHDSEEQQIIETERMASLLQAKEAAQSEQLAIYEMKLRELDLRKQKAEIDERAARVRQDQERAKREDLERRQEREKEELARAVERQRKDEAKRAADERLRLAEVERMAIKVAEAEQRAARAETEARLRQAEIERAEAERRAEEEEARAAMLEGQRELAESPIPLDETEEEARKRNKDRKRSSGIPRPVRQASGWAPLSMSTGGTGASLERAATSLIRGMSLNGVRPSRRLSKDHSSQAPRTPKVM